MLAFQISVNGEVKAVCGVTDLEHLVAYVRAQAPSGQTLVASNVDYSVQCFGFPASEKEVLKWVAAKLQLGDEVAIRLVETETAHQPIDRKKIPDDVHAES